MFNTDLVLTGVGGVPTTYSLTSIVDGKSVRANSAATLGEPNTLTISHGPRNGSPDSPQRHLVRLDLTDSNADGKKATGTAYLVIESPMAIVTAAQIKDLVVQLINFINGAGNLDRVLNNEP